MAGIKLIFFIPAHIVFWIHNYNSVGNTPVFLQFLHSVKTFFLFFYPARKPGLSERSGEHTARTADPN